MRSVAPERLPVSGPTARPEADTRLLRCSVGRWARRRFKSIGCLGKPGLHGAIGSRCAESDSRFTGAPLRDIVNSQLQAAGSFPLRARGYQAGLALDSLTGLMANWVRTESGASQNLRIRGRHARARGIPAADSAIAPPGRRIRTARTVLAALWHFGARGSCFSSVAAIAAWECQRKRHTAPTNVTSCLVVGTRGAGIRKSLLAASFRDHREYGVRESVRQPENTEVVRLCSGRAVVQITGINGIDGTKACTRTCVLRLRAQDHPDLKRGSVG